MILYMQAALYICTTQAIFIIRIFFLEEMTIPFQLPKLIYIFRTLSFSATLDVMLFILLKPVVSGSLKTLLGACYRVAPLIR